MNREGLTPQERYDKFRQAFGTYNCYFKAGNLIGAFVIAFSIFEDRLMALYMLAHEAKGLRKPTGFKRLFAKLEFLRSHEIIDCNQEKEWKEIANIRNQKLHSAMWNLDEFSKKDCQQIISQARIVDKLTRKFK
jgi:hypothetical protein